MKTLQMMKDCLVSQVQGQMSNLSMVDTKELGEVIDMIKDLEEAIYYCTITEAMNEKEHYSRPQMNTSHDPWAEDGSRMYYPNNGRIKGTIRNPLDTKEGQSPKARRMYMEAKELHHDKTIQMKELERYMRELGSDITEMIEDATPEERELLKNKLTHLIQKIDHN